MLSIVLKCAKCLFCLIYLMLLMALCEALCWNVFYTLCVHMCGLKPHLRWAQPESPLSLCDTVQTSALFPPLQCKGWHFFPPDCCTLFSHRGIYMCARNMQQKRLTKAQTASTPDHCNISGFIKAENIKLIYCIFEYSHIFLTSSAALRTVHY